MLACISPKLVSSTHLTGMDCNAMPKGSRTPWKPCPTAPVGSGYLKLTHPHPSDVIYRAIRRPDIPRTFTDDLAAAFSRALETDPRTAARLLRVFPSGQESGSKVWIRRDSAAGAAITNANKRLSVGFSTPATE